jgi:hypothetical protein
MSVRRTERSARDSFAMKAMKIEKMLKMQGGLS